MYVDCSSPVTLALIRACYSAFLTTFHFEESKAIIIFAFFLADGTVVLQTGETQYFLASSADEPFAALRNDLATLATFDRVGVEVPVVVAGFVAVRIVHYSFRCRVFSRSKTKQEIVMKMAEIMHFRVHQTPTSKPAVASCHHKVKIKNHDFYSYSDVMGSLFTYKYGYLYLPT